MNEQMSTTGAARAYGLPPEEELKSLSGMEFLSRIRDGELPSPPIAEDTGMVAAEGRTVRVGRRVGVAHGELRDGDGRILARGSTTCLVFRH
jgi:hypothetical protein